MKTGQLVKQYRINAGLTQSDVANKLGYKIPQFFSLIENGHSKLPLHVCKKLCKVLKLNKQEIDSLKAALIREYSDTVNRKF